MDTFGCTPKFIAENEAAVKALTKSYFDALELINCSRVSSAADGSTRRDSIMGMIIFENDPPYERLEAQSAQAIPTSDGVELVLSVSVEGPTTATVPVRILLTPEVANALARQIEPAAGAARRWIDHKL
jgi:hypothetical protein